jgi:type IV secretion system protein VirD4
MMLDEFPALGRLDFFESALAFMAGYGIRGYLIAQSLNQISKAYGENNAILDNCHVRIAFSSNDERTAKRISDALGTATELRAMRNYAGHRLSPWLGHVMVSRQETARPLLTPGEVMQLPPADELVLVSGIAPIRAKKLRYYEDGNFTTRVSPAPVLSESGFRDCPKPRLDNWGGQVRGLHADLEAAADEKAGDSEDEGGLQKQLNPGPGEKEVAKPHPVEATVDLGIDDDADPAADKNALDRVRPLDPLGQAHAMNEGDLHRDPDRDLLPQF